MHYRKFTPNDRDQPIYELVDDNVTLFDISVNNSGLVEIAFHAGVVGRIVIMDEFQSILDDGIKMAQDAAGTACNSGDMA